MRKSNEEPEAWVAGGDYWLMDDEYSKRLKESKFKY